MKQLNYYKIKLIKNFLQFSEQFIYLFVHTNNFDSVNNIIIHDYLKKNKIEMLSLKHSMLKRLTNNWIFLPLCAGPSKILKFENIESFQNFYLNPQIKKNFIPLIVYWNNNFFTYSIFFSKLQSLKKNKNYLNQTQIITTILFDIQKQFLSFLSILSFKSFLHLLNKR